MKGWERRSIEPPQEKSGWVRLTRRTLSSKFACVKGELPGAYPECRARQPLSRLDALYSRISGMTHVRTSPYYPQSNGKIERWHKSLKSECIRPGTPLSLDDALRLVQGYVEHYNNTRLNSAIGYITPKDMLAGRQQDPDRLAEACRDIEALV